MKQFTLYLLFCFILSACSPTDHKAIENLTNEEPSTTVDSLPFPASWLGIWEGDLEIFKDNQKVQTVPMALEIEHIDSSGNYTWTIVYGPDRETGIRPYELATLDAEKGQYLLDEKNSIKLETYLFGNKLMSWYEVMGRQFLSTQEKRGEEMIFEILFGSAEAISTTGDQIYDGEEIPPVKTFPMEGYQRAILKKK